jgi:eukaryotic-like serine/threonine-protein kinase
MSLASGTKLGPYEIQSAIGAGGMGEVYRARDSRLGRDVALKILPESFAHESDRLHRFEQEARAVATLNHPNILAVFDIGQQNGSPYLVSELLEGETLRTVLDHGALSQRKAIDYGVQIAQGLAAAHEKGIVHRDLKPENIFVTKDARVKILDFGLAKQAQKATVTASDGVTLTSSHTAAGVVMGTASYMAPEQVRGDLAEPRTDIFAFGAVLYETLSGKRAFRRDTPAETMTAVLKEDPPDLTGPGHPVSPALDRIVRRCLEKTPDQRFQSAKDLSFALSALSGTDSSAATRIHTPTQRLPIFPWAIVALALGIGAAVAWFFVSRPVSKERMQFAIPINSEVSHMALSPDGSMLVFVSPDENSQLPVLLVQRIGSSDVRLLTGTEGASYPFWSPDGSYIAFFANGKLQKVSVNGGTPQLIARVQSARGGSWSTRGVIVYSPDASGELWRVNADGTGAQSLTGGLFEKNENTHRWPVFLPDGSHFLFWAGSFGDMRTDVYSGIFVSSLEAKEKRLVIRCHSSFGFSTNRLFYANDDQQLVSVAFDLLHATVSGSTDLLARNVAFQPAVIWAAVTVAQNGTVVYNTSGAPKSVLNWMDRSGKDLGQIGKPAVQFNPMLSPDGTRVALDVSDQKANAVEVWIERVDGSASSRFTFDGSEDVVPIWSRDGGTIAYRKNTGQGSYLVVKKASGLEAAHDLFLAANTEDAIPNSWTADDAQIVDLRQTVADYRLELLPAHGGKPVPLFPGHEHQTNGQISPDGKWLAYASDESGDWEVYVTTFPAATGKWQVSRGGGTEPRWRGDGKEIFYLGPRGMMTAVPVSTLGTFSTGTPVQLFQFHGRAAISSTDLFSYDVTKDGKRFLVNRYVKPEAIAPLTIVLNAGAVPEK